MAGESRRQLILAELDERLRTIKIADGFNTDAGLAVILGQDVDLGESDPAAVIVLGSLPERFLPNQTKLYSEWPLSIKAVIKARTAAELDDAWILAEQIIADVQVAVEQSDRTLDGLVNWNGAHGLILDSIVALQREVGSLEVGMEIIYTAKLQRSWGNPRVAA